MLSFFWWSVVLVLYIYIGYPLLIRFFAMSKRPKFYPENPLPKVTILTAAFNEKAHIAETIRNKFELDYPHELVEMIVISDCSDDGTDELVRSLIDEAPFPLRLIRQESRLGKTSGLNLAVPEASGDLLIFSDANSIFEVNALRQLVLCFDNPEVGYATGKMIYTQEDGTIAGDGCSAYMRYENQLRSWETEIGSIVGVDGGIDAMRRELYSPLKPDQLPDFVQPLKVVEKGFKVAYQPKAVLHEEALNDPDREYRMRVRVGLRALWALWDMKQLHNPFFFGLFSFQLISHKSLRYLAFIPLILAFLSNVGLMGSHPIYSLSLVIQIAFYTLAFLGWRSNAAVNSVWLKLPYYFVLINWASMHAFIKFVSGQKMATWQPRLG